ncbi:uncharacterized protein JCM6883_004774 [Sporobolomyces salmoneus]|uniref:uncharacterized protein n=1 Tax=Sporobolomyces salmoneus TaxID=183962 RepID=UPI00316D8371
MFGVPGGIARSISPVPTLHLANAFPSTSTNLADSPTFDPMLPPVSGGGGTILDPSTSSSSSFAPIPPPLDDPPQRSISGSSARTRGPPNRSQTMDDKFYEGGVSPSSLRGRTAPPSRNQWGAIGQVLPPRAPGLYNQQNHSSPSLALNNGTSTPQSASPGLIGSNNGSNDGAGYSSFSPFDAPDVPPVPSLDDINLGLENMKFEQRRTNSGTPASIVGENSRRSLERQQQQHQQKRWDSPVSIGSLPTVGGSDGAMEIRGRGGQTTTSVYSLEGQQLQQNWMAADGGGERRDSGSSHRTYGGNYAGADSQSVDGYNDESRRSSVGSYLPYDDAYRGGGGAESSYQQPQQNVYSKPSIPSIQQPYASQPSYDSPSNVAGYFPSVPEHPSQNIPAQYARSSSPHPSSTYAQSTYSAYPSQQQPQQPQPSFAPHPSHNNASWGYEAYQQAAASNPYYAAATGQLGLDPGGGGGGLAAPSQAGPYGQMNRGISSASSLGVNSISGGSLARSQSSLNIPGGGMRRKPTSGSAVSVSSVASSGPPITKASVDEYRQRIKADPDPEAQFNFAKYLIEAAKKINSSSSADEKTAKKYRDALLAEPVKLIKRLATQGGGLGKPAYADAQFFLANCLGNGSLGLQVDHEKAYNLYVQASKQNHSAATYRTAVCNEVGAGTRRDHARAVLFYRKASALGDTAGMYKLGMILLNGLLGQQRNPKEALAWLRRAASQADEDNPHALHELGLLYEKPPPISVAAASLGSKAAAAQGHPTPPPGQPLPTIVPFDPGQAREFFTQAAQYGYPPSQFKLGCCYEYGSLTCPVDPRRSIAWYTRAAERGDAEAELALSGWYLTGSEGVLKQSDSEAYLWARRAANKGLAKAEYAVGYYSEVGIGVKQDGEEAKRWYMRAAAQGNKRAMQRLTELKKLGERGAKGKNHRPTRKEAETECVIS